MKTQRLPFFAVVTVVLTFGCGISVGENDPSTASGSSTSTTTTTTTTTSAQQQCRQSCNSGCCTSTGECVAGTTEAACGATGNGCQTCPGAQRCELTTNGGACRPCSQLNCNGCCTTSGLCLAGTENAACGDGGQTCTSCPGYCAPYPLGGGRCQ